MPGALLTFSPNGNVVETCWWRPPRPTNEFDDANAVIEQSLDILRDSVRRQLIADVPLGLFLSGGIDSSMVVALASESAGPRLETFSIGFSDERYDERPYARFVAERFNTHHHEFLLQPQNMEMIELIAWHADEPFADPAALPTWFLSEMTRGYVTVALSGDGGDELFAGYDVYRSHRLSERLRRVPASVRRFAVTALRSSHVLGRDSIRALRLARNIEDAGLLAPERFIAKQQTVFRREFLAQVSTLLAPLASANTDRRLFSELFAHDLDPLGAIALWQQTVSLPDDMLHKVDRMSMAHALEVRAPFLDARLAELLNRTSFSVKLRDGRQKYVLRKALERYLPADFVWRPKHGFAVPLAHWFKDDLAGFVRDRLLAPDAIVQRVIKQSTLTQIMADHARGARDWSNALWALLIFELWCRSSGITGDSIVDA
jgi:asparagine synthase (glutamine-hydrolysing)